MSESGTGPRYQISSYLWEVSIWKKQGSFTLSWFSAHLTGDRKLGPAESFVPALPFFCFYEALRRKVRESLCMLRLPANHKFLSSHCSCHIIGLLILQDYFSLSWTEEQGDPYLSLSLHPSQRNTNEFLPLPTHLLNLKPWSRNFRSQYNKCWRKLSLEWIIGHSV